jgi:hypothetical protein
LRLGALRLRGRCALWLLCIALRLYVALLLLLQVALLFLRSDAALWLLRLAGSCWTFRLGATLRLARTLGGIGAVLELLCELVALLDLFGDSGGRSTDVGARNDGPSEGSLRGCAVVLVEELLVILNGHLACLNLSVHGRRVVLVACGKLRRAGTDIDAAATAVVADAVYDSAAVTDVVVDNVVAIHVVNDVDIHVSDSAVVVEVVILPVATVVADADVAKAVVDAAIEADVGSPVAVVEGVTAAIEAPVGRCPKGPVIGRRAPGAGNPIIASVGVAPVAGGPKVIGFRSGWLVVLGERRRSLIRVEGLVVGFGSGLVVLWGLLRGVISVILIRGCGLIVVLALVVARVAAADDGSGRLLAGAVGFGLLLRLIGGAGAHDLRRAARVEVCGRGVWGVGVGVGTGGDWRRGCAAALATGEGEGED